VSVDLASPATPEAVYWALEAARSRHTENGHVGQGAGLAPPQPGNGAQPMRPFSERFQDTRSHA
jgi:xanthine dehydrogenase large subunit